MIKFGPSGNSVSFYAEGYTHTEEAAKYVKERGLDCFEYSFGRGVRMSEEKAISLRRAFEAQGVEISVHAPYFINFANPSDEMAAKSYEYVLQSANMARLMGAKRVVLAREMSPKEVKEIRSKCSVELEMFVHGAMCISYSGRCLMSNYLTGRDANRGSCAQPCRWNYALMEEKRPGQYFPVLEDERGTYIFNSKDMCLLPYLPDVIESGVDSLKIEGRMKSVHYAASVVKAYREAIDSYFENPEGFAVKKEWLEELDKVSHRAYTTGFYYGRPTEKDQIYGTSSYIQTSDFVGLVLEYDETTGFATVEQRNNMKIGQEIEVFQPKLAGYRQVLSEMYNDEGEPIDVAPHPQQIVKIRMAQPVEPYAILRRDI